MHIISRLQYQILIELLQNFDRVVTHFKDFSDLIFVSGEVLQFLSNWVEMWWTFRL